MAAKEGRFRLIEYYEDDGARKIVRQIQEHLRAKCNHEFRRRVVILPQFKRVCRLCGHNVR